MAGGSADAAAALRLAARASGMADDALLLEIAAGLGADVPAQVRPARYVATGAGERLEPAPEPPPFGVLVLRCAAALSTAAVFAEADRQGLARDAAELARLAGAVRSAAAEGRALLPPELAVNDLEPAARALCPPVGEALDAARAAGADQALLCGSGPTVLGLFADVGGGPRRGRGARRPRAAARWPCGPGARARRRRREAGLARRRGGPRGLPRAAPAPAGADAAHRRRDRRRRHGGLRLGPRPRSPTCRRPLEDVGRGLGAWTYLLVGVMAFFETGAFIGLLAPGETVMLVGGLVAGQGEINVVRLIGIAWAARRRRRRHELRPRAAPGPGVPRPPRAEGLDHRGAPARRSRRSSRATAARRSCSGASSGIVRAVAPFLAGSSGLALRRFLPYDVIGAGLWVVDLHPAGLRLLGELRPRRALRRAGRAGAGDRHRRRRRR